MSFESLSKTAWILPGPAWVALPIILVLALRSAPFFRVWGIVFGVTTALDAYLNGAWSPVSPTSAWSTVFGITFVYLGDLRLYSALLWDGTRRSLGVAALVSWVTPVLAQVLRALFPAIALVPRRTFLTYELTFLVVLFVLTRTFRERAPMTSAFARDLCLLFAAQYGLWILSDVVLLGVGADAGYALRMIPDFVYYAGFIPFALLRSWSRPTLAVPT
jgi:hypothetical protein